ncbi:TetR family transcriptional regulator [Ideonella sp. BN130291]|uniref:TetR family transcriptional regulator n=1 Tax=Ideonella sp. BN130291 TaxID=3112940 RepID=UPI002E25CF3F|nr:TetR family transcriptional regulator [Ideonella sp. BN130291]
MPSRRTATARQPATRSTAARTTEAATTENVNNRRAELVRVAARLFREKGFDGTTVRDIAHAVDMRSGSPFYHFANKHELLMAVMEEGLRLGLERTEEVLSSGTGELPAAERFRRLVRTHYGILHDTGSDFIPVMLYDWRSLPDEYKRRIIKLKDRYDAIWQATIDELHAQGLLRAEPKFARLLILGAINFSGTWYKPKSRAAGSVDLDALAEQTTQLFLQASPARARPGAAPARTQAPA